MGGGLKMERKEREGWCVCVCVWEGGGSRPQVLDARPGLHTFC